MEGYFKERKFKRVGGRKIDSFGWMFSPEDVLSPIPGIRDRSGLRRARESGGASDEIRAH